MYTPVLLKAALWSASVMGNVAESALIHNQTSI